MICNKNYYMSNNKLQIHQSNVYQYTNQIKCMKKNLAIIQIVLEESTKKKILTIKNLQLKFAL